MNIEGEVSMDASCGHPSAQELIHSLAGAYAQKASTELEAQAVKIALSRSSSLCPLLDRERSS